MPRVKVDKGDKQKPLYKSARDEYVYNPANLPLEEIARRWKLGIQAVRGRCTKQGWVKARAVFQKEMEIRAANAAMDDLVDKRKDVILQANADHVNIGRILWNRGVNVITKKDKDGKFINSLTASEAIRAMKEGVIIERKGLGLEDRNIIVQHVEKFTDLLITVIMKYESNPEIIDNIVGEFDLLVGQQKDELLREVDSFTKGE